MIHGRYCGLPSAKRHQTRVDQRVGGEATRIASVRWVTAHVQEAADTGAAGLTWAMHALARTKDTPAGTETIGHLRALCEAHLSGLTAFATDAETCRDALADIRLTPRTSPGMDFLTTTEDNSLYLGAAGRAAALRSWAAVAGDETAMQVAATTLDELEQAEPSPIRDLLLGDAGVLLGLVEGERLTAAGRIADSLLAAAEPSGAGLDWRMEGGMPFSMPNFSHGTAGVAFALSRAGRALDRTDLIEAAHAGARRLVELGQRSDGTLAVPHSVPQQDWSAPQSWGWCHGPTGTVQLFLELAGDDSRWQDGVDASLQAVRSSGLPARLHPGFWDNHSQCCGTAGVGELALDRYQATGDEHWLTWSDELAANLVSFAIPQDVGVAWSNVEHTSPEPDLPPDPGWLQGAAGIASYLLRHARVHREGRYATRVPWPDRV